MRETPDLIPPHPRVDRGVARALLQKRIEAARHRPEWASAMRMAGALSPKGAEVAELEAWALGCLEDGILSISDLYRKVDSGRHEARD